MAGVPVVFFSPCLFFVNELPCPPPSAPPPPTGEPVCTAMRSTRGTPESSRMLEGRLETPSAAICAEVGLGGPVGGPPRFVLGVGGEGEYAVADFPLLGEPPAPPPLPPRPLPLPPPRPRPAAVGDVLLYMFPPSCFFSMRALSSSCFCSTAFSWRYAARATGSMLATLVASFCSSSSSPAACCAFCAAKNSFSRPTPACDGAALAAALAAAEPAAAKTGGGGAAFCSPTSLSTTSAWLTDFPSDDATLTCAATGSAPTPTCAIGAPPASATTTGVVLGLGGAGAFPLGGGGAFIFGSDFMRRAPLLADGGGGTLFRPSVWASMGGPGAWPLLLEEVESMALARAEPTDDDRTAAAFALSSLSFAESRAALPSSPCVEPARPAATFAVLWAGGGGSPDPFRPKNIKIRTYHFSSS